MSTHSQPAGSDMTSRSPTLVTAVLVGAAFLAGIDLFIVNVALDDIGRDLAPNGGSDLSQLSWVLNAYAVVFAALLVPMGRLTDRYGRKAGFTSGYSSSLAPASPAGSRRLSGSS